jgi:hypothetical protein
MLQDMLFHFHKIKEKMAMLVGRKQSGFVHKEHSSNIVVVMLQDMLFHFHEIKEKIQKDLVLTPEEQLR